MTYEEFRARYQATFSPPQERALLRERGVTLVLGVPGSGKSAVVTTHAAYLICCCGVPAQQILTLTDTRTAAREMDLRFRQIFGRQWKGPVFSTVHGLCHSILNYAKRVYGLHLPDLETDSAKLVRQTVFEEVRNWPTDYVTARLTGLLTQARNRMLSPEQVKRIRCPELEEQFPSLSFQRVQELYEEYRKRNNCMDPDDLLLLTLQVLQENPEVLTHYQELYPYLGLDEAQDLSQLQFRILHLLADGCTGFLVAGNDDESICGYRGAEPGYLREFRAHYPEAEIISLQTDYRSGKSIVSTANRFIRENSLRMDKNPVSDREEEGMISTFHKENAPAMYSEVARIIRNWTPEDGTLAVLARNSFVFLPLTDMLNQADVHVRRRDGFRAFFVHPVVRGICGMLTLSGHPENYEAFEKICGMAKILLTKEQMERVAELAQSGDANRSILEIVRELFRGRPYIIKNVQRVETVLERIRSQTTSDAIRTIVAVYAKGTGRPGENLSERTIYPRVLAAIAGSYADTDAFLEGMDRLEAGLDQLEADNRVTLSTIGSVKGQEFDRVILLDTYEGVLPMRDAENPEEEARLFYVAMTRARTRLDFYIPKTYYGVEVSASRFLYRMQGLTQQTRQKRAQQADNGEEAKTAAWLQQPSLPRRISSRPPRRSPTLAQGWRAPATAGPAPEVGDHVQTRSFGPGTVELKEGHVLHVRLPDGSLKRLMDSFCTRIT